MIEKRTLIQYIDYIIAFAVGAVISIMVVFNTELGKVTTNEVSIAVNQLVGIIALTIIMLLGHKSQKINPKREKSAWWQWFGGLFGLGVITINYYSVSNAGTTIAMATSVLGQCLMGVVFDLTGWMGMKKEPITNRKILSLIISALGIAIMLFFQLDRNNLSATLFGLLGIGAGILTMVQMVYNSGFAAKKGAFFSARQNVISGLAGILLFMLIFTPTESINGIKTLANTPLYILLGGGLLACIVVVSTNTIIPRIPGAVSAILLSTGQILMAVLIDGIMTGTFEPSLLIGSIIMLIGIFIGG